MSYQSHMMSTRYNANGEHFEVEDVEVEFSGEGAIIQVNIFNALLEDWFPIDFTKLNSFDQNKIQEFVYKQLININDKLTEKQCERGSV